MTTSSTSTSSSPAEAAAVTVENVHSSSPSPPMLVLKSIAIPVVLTSVTAYQLRDHLNAFCTFFYQEAEFLDQTALLLFFFSVLFGILSLALALLQDDYSNRHAALSSTKSLSSEKQPPQQQHSSLMKDIFVATTTSSPDPKKKKENKTKELPSFQPYPLEALAKCTTDTERLECMYPLLRDEILSHVMEHCNEMIPEAVQWCRDMMDYTVPGGKYNRGTHVLAVWRALKKQSQPDSDDVNVDLTPLEMTQAVVCGWSLEFLQAFFLVADDVMDDSKTRRGKPCWFRQGKVGLTAINDSFLLESFVYSILKLHFLIRPAMNTDGTYTAADVQRLEHIYLALQDVVLDVVQKTEFGQALDLTSQPADAKQIDLSRFTLERYQLIVKYKTAFYSFYLPTAMGMILYGMKNDDNNQEEDVYQITKDICCTMGEYFQIQDDYLDCFGDPKVIGKIGTDIQENKCSWLVVQALRLLPTNATDRTTKNRRKLLEDNYGQWNDNKVNKIKNLYKELNLPQVFAEYEEESYRTLRQQIDAISNIVPADIFYIMLQKIYKRSK